MLMTISNLVGCMTGKSAGLVPYALGYLPDPTTTQERERSL
jgi:hypothetical protein